MNETSVFYVLGYSCEESLLVLDWDLAERFSSVSCKPFERRFP